MPLINSLASLLLLNTLASTNESTILPLLIFTWGTVFKLLIISSLVRVLILSVNKASLTFKAFSYSSFPLKSVMMHLAKVFWANRNSLASLCLAITSSISSLVKKVNTFKYS